MQPGRRSIGLGLITAALSVLFGSADSARAVILFESAVRNTEAPTGLLRNSGWQYQGDFRNFTGIPISKKYFITAGHIGGIAGNKLRLNGRSFTTTAHWDDPASDLRIYTVNKRFDFWAPLYTDNREVGKHAMIFGRGTQRGAEVVVNGKVQGWEWGIEDRVYSWGSNAVDAVIQGDPDEGSLLEFDFDGPLGAIPFEATLSAGDSGGGVFIYDRKTKQWQLAGINYSVDGPFSRTPGGQTFQAALYDMGGMYYGNQQIPDNFLDVPQKFYATRISSNMDWIMGVLGGRIDPTMVTQEWVTANSPGKVPEPATAGVVAAGAILLLARRRS